MEKRTELDVSEEFRSVIRSAAAEATLPINQYLIKVFDFVPTDKTGKKVLKFDSFERGIRSISKKFNKNHLEDIFDEVDEKGKGIISVEELVDFSQRTLSRPRTLALKLRKEIVTHYGGVSEYKIAFNSVSQNSKYIEKRNFRDFVEEMLDTNLSDNESDFIYGIYDTDGDGKISLEDFLGFLEMQAPDAVKAIDPGNPETILDIKVTNSVAQDMELSNEGYTQVLPLANGNKQVGTFGRSQSMWIWRRKQGTCGGKLKPVIDIQLEDFSYSSAMVASGYICLPLSISGQYVWIKRAKNKEEEKDALVDLAVTVGKMKVSADKIHTSPNPGMGWVKVAGNFSRGILSSFDSFLWYIPARTRTIDMMSPTRDVVSLSEEVLQEKIFLHTRYALRNFVFPNRMRETAFMNVENIEDSVTKPSQDIGSVSLFHMYSKGSDKHYLSLGKFEQLLNDIGIRLDRNHIGQFIFHYFDVKQDKSINREEYFLVCSLSDYELDECVLQMREKFNQVTQGHTKIKHSRMLKEIFKISDLNENGYITSRELQFFLARLEIFVTEDECRRISELMDLDKDGKINEKDFIQFLQLQNDISVRKAYRVREGTLMLRRWMMRGSGSQDARSKGSLWQELQRIHTLSYGKAFSGVLNSNDLYFLFTKLSNVLTPLECKEVLLMISPNGDGEITERDLEDFVGNISCRNVGELLSLLDKDILKPLSNACREVRKAIQLGDATSVVKRNYEEIFNNLVALTQNNTNVESGASGAGNEVKHDIVSIKQVINGVEQFCRSYTQLPPDKMLSAEEWACLASLSDSTYFNVRHYGVDIRKLIEGICEAILGDMSFFLNGQDKATIDMICRELQRMLFEEAKAAAAKSRSGKSVDYAAIFSLFDEDGSGSITPDELQHVLTRLQLVDNASEKQVAELLSKFDTHKKGYINIDDFQLFVEGGGYVQINKDDDNDDSDAEDEGWLSSNTAPAAISKNAECDWLAWFLWRQAYKYDKTDPEGVITELENSCAEREIIENTGAVAVNELLEIIHFLKLKGSMTKDQFNTGIEFLKFQPDGSKGGEKLVDYEGLCRYTIRMGRAFNTKLQEKEKEVTKKYTEMKTQLIKELLSEAASDVSNSKVDKAKDRDIDPFDSFKISKREEMLKFEKVFRRLDEDGDGKITVQEFKDGLKRLHVKEESKWSTRLVRRLFNDIDKNNDGKITLSELTSFVRGSNDKDSSKDKKTKLLDEEKEEEEKIFKKEKTISEVDLLKKITLALIAVVPKSGAADENHLEVVKASVRKFFQRADPDDNGLVTEERFRAFCWRSSLSETLTASELRLLIDTLRRKRINKSQAGAMIDYEKFIRLLSKNASSETSSLGHSKGESAIAKIQDSAIESAAGGRPFLGLCSLLDQKLTGKISTSDLIYACKMMGCTVTTDEVKSLKELLPLQNAKDDTYDYRELFWLVQNYENTNSKKGIHDFGARTLNNNRLGATSMYNSTPVPPIRLNDTPSSNYRRNKDFTSSVVTPLGFAITTPFETSRYDNTLSASGGDLRQDEIRVLNSIADRIQYAVDDKSRSWGAPFSLRKQFDVYDTNEVGLVSLRTFQGVLDDLGVLLSPPEIYVIQRRFGRPEDDSVDYMRFHQDLFEGGLNSRSSGPRFNNNQTSDRRYNNVASSSMRFPDPSRSTERLRELRQEGKDPRDIFEAYDLDDTGLIEIRKFRDIVKRLQLLTTEAQLSNALENYVSINDRSMICYKDFCRDLEDNTATQNVGYGSRAVRRSTDTYGRSSEFGRSKDLYGDHGDDGVFSSQNIEKWYRNDASPREQSDFKKVYGSLERFKASLEEDELLPPRPIRSGSTSARSSARGIADSNDLTLGGTSTFRQGSPLRAKSPPISAPRSPPSKVGSVMWGNDTPLAHKGLAPTHARESHWVCGVCYFTENHQSAKKCEVCDSPNYNAQKDFQIKEQCSNCTFLNGYLATKCEMCGFKLPKGNNKR